MVQNISNPNLNSNSNLNGYGSINRIGMTNNGRIVYQVIDAEGKEAGKMSVSRKDRDTFEKSYRDMMESAPKLQHYAMTTSPEKMRKKKNMAKWIVTGCGVLGGLWPLLKYKPGSGFWNILKQTGVTLLGTGAGLVLGIGIAAKTTTPPGAAKFAKATQNMSKLDIQPVQD